MKKVTKESLKNDILNLGIKEGDILFITGGMKSIGSRDDIEGNLYDYFIPLLLDILGESGTLVTYAYTKQYILRKIKDDDIFTDSTASDSGGAIANIMLNYKGAVRSTHPTSSCVAIGKYAHKILDEHTPNSTSYSVLKKLVEFDAKLIVFGCLDTNPGMPLLHYVEESLGLIKKNTSFMKWIGFSRGVYYFDKEGNKQLFKKGKDYGGCYYRTYRLFKEYDNRNLWVKGNIGKSIAIQVKAVDSFNLEYELISTDNGIVSCDNNLCLRCNLFAPRKKNALLKFFTYKVWLTIGAVFFAVCRRKSIREVFWTTKTDYDIYKDPIFSETVNNINKLYSKF